MKKWVTKAIGLLMAVMLFTLSPMETEASAFAVKTQSVSLRSAYTNVMNYAKKNGIDLGMSYDDFVSNYQGQSVASYEQEYYKVLSPQAFEKVVIGGEASVNSSSSSSSSGDKIYYYNTGTSCPSKATYGKYKLLSNVQKGDIIFEGNGGYGITGHIAVVEGIYSRGDGTQYIRLIEAIDVGVVRSILDDKRVVDKDVTVLRVKNATSTQINNAVSFCVSQLGKKYKLDFAKDTSKNEKDWYCSELAWAAYKNQGIDIEVGGLNEPGITPRDIKRCNKVKTISIK